MDNDINKNIADEKQLLLVAFFTFTFSWAQTWNTTGNAGTTPAGNFIGTTDDKELVFKTGNTERLRIFNGPYVNGITIGNRSAVGTPAGGRLEITTALCSGCSSRWAVPSDVIVRTMGSRNMEFHMPNNAAEADPASVSTHDSPGITKIKFTDSVHKSSLVVFNNGKVTVGTDRFDNDPDYLFYVRKGIKAGQVKVESPAVNGWADYVFKKDYKLRSLADVEHYIAEKGHLPNIPSAEEVAKEGINLGEMDARLLEKIEELTLYSIEQNRQIQQLQTENRELKRQSAKIERLENQIQQLLTAKK